MAGQVFDRQPVFEGAKAMSDDEATIAERHGWKGRAIPLDVLRKVGQVEEALEAAFAALLAMQEMWPDDTCPHCGAIRKSDDQ